MATSVLVDNLGKRRAAAEADLGEHVNDLVDALGRQWLAVGATVALLAAARTFALRLGLALVLLAGAGAIARWREVRVARVLTELLEQPRDLGLEFGDLGLEFRVFGLELREPRTLAASLHMTV